jgi:hypothetical protein
VPHLKEKVIFELGFLLISPTLIIPARVWGRLLKEKIKKTEINSSSSPLGYGAASWKIDQKKQK